MAEPWLNLIDTRLTLKLVSTEFSSLNPLHSAVSNYNINMFFLSSRRGYLLKSAAACLSRCLWQVPLQYNLFWESHIVVLHFPNYQWCWASLYVLLGFEAQKVLILIKSNLLFSSVVWVFSVTQMKMFNTRSCRLMPMFTSQNFIVCNVGLWPFLS